jgi:hypothetical protein
MLTHEDARNIVLSFWRVTDHAELRATFSAASTPSARRSGKEENEAKTLTRDGTNAVTVDTSGYILD